jgi:hypothetical protein
MTTQRGRPRASSALLILGLMFTLIALPKRATADPLGQTGSNPTEAAGARLIPYEDIGPTLEEIAAASNRVKVEVLGASAGERDLYLVTVADPKAMGRLGKYQLLRRLMLEDPERAQEMIDQFDEFKVPVFINASIHGNEPEGVDAAIKLIRTLAFEDTGEVRAILDNVILLVNVVANPDGRVLNQRRNANGFDLNRDFITQSQPETQATVGVLTAWNPMVLLDLHGYYNPMLLDPCTPPHNPNYEYDIYIKWALDQAEAMEEELLYQTGLPAQIPYRDWEEGWDDWAPIFTPQYAMYHGAYAHTLETSYRGERGVDAHYAAAWGALKFVAQNKKEMIWDQIEIFRRGFLDLDQVPISDELLAETPYYQWNELTTLDFPRAYVIPALAPLQQNPHQAARLVDFMITNDIQVEWADDAFGLQEVEYPEGSYVVWMNQPKRGLANTILWDGWDISSDPGLDMYDISSWSHPHLWGVTRVEVLDETFSVPTSPIDGAHWPGGEVEDGADVAAYAFLPTSKESILATNRLLNEGRVALLRATAPFQDAGREFGTGTVILPSDPDLAYQLAREYGLDISALAAFPDDVAGLPKPHVVTYADEGTTWFLETYGFDATILNVDDLSGTLDLSAFDIFVSQSDLSSGIGQPAVTALEAFFAGGGDLVGIGRYGISASVQFGLSPGVTFVSLSGNGIVKVEYDPDHAISAQYPADSYGFVYRPVFFTSTGDPGMEMAVVASIPNDDDFFVSGFWSGWEDSGAAGKPVVLHGARGDSNVTLLGLDPTFRAHPEHTFRLLANAIFSWRE